MVDALSSDDAEAQSGKKPNFVAKVENSEYQSDEYQVKEEYLDEGQTRADYFEHLYELDVLKVLGDQNKDAWDNLHEFSVKLSNSWDSKWMVFLGHLENIHGPLGENGISDYDDLAEFMKGRVYEFRDINWEEDEQFVWNESPDNHSVMLNEVFADGEFSPNNFIVPVREVDEDEIADLGVEETASEADVEEVDL